MPTSWNAVGDFTNIVDGLESVTLLRHGNTQEITIDRAWRFSRQTDESEPAGGYAPVANIVWQFEWDPLLLTPQVGDRLLDTTGDCWTLLSVESMLGATRWRCQSRNLRVAHSLDCLLTVEQAVWEDLGSGLEITGWSLFQSAVHARVQPELVAVDEVANPITSTATYRIVLEESLPLDHNHRFVANDGVVYRLLRFEQADRIDVLPVAMVRKE